MVNDFPFVGVVLNGGRSERMGTDKADLALGEETLLQLTISGLREASASSIYVVGKESAEFLGRDVIQINDILSLIHI